MIRGVGCHGMEVQLVIHLARTFASKADTLDKVLNNIFLSKFLKIIFFTLILGLCIIDVFAIFCNFMYNFFVIVT